MLGHQRSQFWMEADPLIVDAGMWHDTREKELFGTLGSRRVL